jgi:hypothetical protein
MDIILIVLIYNYNYNNDYYNYYNDHYHCNYYHYHYIIINHYYHHAHYHQHLSQTRYYTSASSTTNRTLNLCFCSQLSLFYPQYPHEAVPFNEGAWPAVCQCNSRSSSGGRDRCRDTNRGIDNGS